MCDRCYQRFKSNGDPTVMRRRANGALFEELEAAANSDTSDCIIPSFWRPGVRNVLFRGRTTNASRAAWTIAFGDPGSRDVLHRCNGGSGAHGCINVRHLYLGDDAMNSQDMIAAGRAAPTQGEANGRAKLTADEVREIRRRYVRGRGPYDPGNGAALRSEFGIAATTLSQIITGQHWPDT